MATKRYSAIDDSIVRSLSEVLGRTHGGLTNKEIDELLAAARIDDPTPAAAPGTYVMIAKRDRLYNALAARQRRDGCGNAQLAQVQSDHKRATRRDRVRALSGPQCSRTPTG